MKKAVFCLVMVVLLFSLFFTQAPQTVSATGIGEGSWVLPGAASGTTYTTVDIEKAAESAPSWVRLFSDGIKISAPSKICYSFPRGAFHWVPKFMQLKKGSWVSVGGSIEYLNGDEGGAFACAKPSEAGTYALFAYYNGPKESFTQPGQLFTVGSWSMQVGKSPSLAFGEIYASNVNWQGYPEATYLAWGIKTCSGSECTEYPDAWIEITPSSFPHPQNYTVTVVSGLTRSFTSTEGCVMEPFVELLDDGYNVLGVIYYESTYYSYCVS